MVQGGENGKRPTATAAAKGEARGPKAARRSVAGRKETGSYRRVATSSKGDDGGVLEPPQTADWRAGRPDVPDGSGRDGNGPVGRHVF